MLTILQALKRIKHLDRKIEKNKSRIQKWCSYLDPAQSPPQYDTNKLIQSVNDMLNERAMLRHALHTTNALYKVKYKGKEVTIDELLILSTITIPAKIAIFKLQRRVEIPYQMRQQEAEKQKVVMQYDPNKRDQAIDSFENELAEIDALLDEINISTDVFYQQSLK